MWVLDAGLAGADVGGLYSTIPSEVVAILLATEWNWQLWV